MQAMMPNTGTINHGEVVIERIDKRLLAGEPTYLFNIYGIDHMRNTGSTGMYYIPACPEGQEYVRSPHHIDGTVIDQYPQFDDKERYRALPTFGEDIVKAVINGGNANDDISQWGVFASKSEAPSKSELSQARQKLKDKCALVVQEADRYAMSADSADRMSITDKHYRAARFLRLKRPWMTDVAALDACPFCSTPISANVPKCPNCHEVVNKAAYDALKLKIGA